MCSVCHVSFTGAEVCPFSINASYHPKNPCGLLKLVLWWIICRGGTMSLKAEKIWWGDISQWGMSVAWMLERTWQVTLTAVAICEITDVKFNWTEVTWFLKTGPRRGKNYWSQVTCPSCNLIKFVICRRIFVASKEVGLLSQRFHSDNGIKSLFNVLKKSINHESYINHESQLLILFMIYLEIFKCYNLDIYI